MSDGLPTDEQLRRIERGVQRRIDRRRRTAQRLAQASVAVVLIAGGVALLNPLGGALSTSGGSSGSAARPAAGAALVPVVCHGSSARTVRVDEADLPASALRACAPEDARLRPQAAEGGAGTASAGAATPSPGTGVLCRSADGDLHVWADGTTCRSHGMTPSPS